MEQFLLIKALEHSLPEQPAGTERENIIRELIEACESLVNYSQSNSMISKNEEFCELTEEELVCLESNFLLAKCLSDFEIDKEVRYKTVIEALNQMQLFIDNLLLFDLFTEEQLKLIAKELSPAQEREVRRSNLLEEEKYKKEAKQLFEVLINHSDDALKVLRLDVQQKKFEAVREIRFLSEEMELLEFENSEPEAARNARNERLMMQNQQNKQPLKIVQLDSQTADKIAKGGKFVPLDTVELLKMQQEQEEQSNLETDANNIIKQEVETSAKIDWNALPLEEEGGNPYNPSNVEYNVVRTDYYEIGEEEPEKEFTWADDVKERENSEETQEEWKEKVEWDNWKDEHPTGQGNKPRMV